MQLFKEVSLALTRADWSLSTHHHLHNVLLREQLHRGAASGPLQVATYEVAMITVAPFSPSLHPGPDMITM